MQFSKNAGATTVAYVLAFFKWGAWILGGLAGLVGVYFNPFLNFGSSVTHQGTSIFFFVMAGVLYLAGKGIDTFRSSIIVTSDQDDVRDEITVILGEEEIAKIEQLEVGAHKATAEVEQIKEAYFEEGGIDEEGLEAILAAKKRSAQDIDMIELSYRLSRLVKKTNTLNGYLNCHLDALSQAVQLHKEGRTAATVKQFYWRELARNTQGNFMEGLGLALMASNIEKYIIASLRKNPNQQHFDVEVIKKRTFRQANALANDEDLTVDKITRLL